MHRHGSYIPKGEVQVFQNVESEFYSIAVAGLGKEDVGFNTLENLDECRENVRVAAGAGARALSSLGISMISVEGFGQAEAAAEGAALATWRFQDFKAKEDQKGVPHLELFMDADSYSICMRRGNFIVKYRYLLLRVDMKDFFCLYFILLNG
ncbi:hypothetical protein ANN_02848 [Periplaneta americana]|uniref:Peptidase M17 leucyl aminopeptidase N-terminal domain-containing protein n=1 Tax=Periplaneta americana TaxID=6978 RepID=A0ABQ8TZ34_PERAM|nr:hypothetical protein ANN_02848 [Periplaneta americana]